ncbi:MAG: hypothetical protein ACREKE_01575, partial [bacterium]
MGAPALAWEFVGGKVADESAVGKVFGLAAGVAAEGAGHRLVSAAGTAVPAGPAGEFVAWVLFEMETEALTPGWPAWRWWRCQSVMTGARRRDTGSK